MDASEMPRRETPERSDGADAPVGRVGGRIPSTLSTGGDAPAAGRSRRASAGAWRASARPSTTSGTKCISLRCSTSSEFNNSLYQPIGRFPFHRELVGIHAVFGYDVLQLLKI